MKKLLIILLLCVSVPAYAGKTTSLLLGAGAGAVAGYLVGKAQQPTVVQQAQPLQTQAPAGGNSTIICYSDNGAQCWDSHEKKHYTPAQWVAKAGYKFIVRSNAIPRESFGYNIIIEVRN